MTEVTIAMGAAASRRLANAAGWAAFADGPDRPEERALLHRTPGLGLGLEGGWHRHCAVSLGLRHRTVWQLDHPLSAQGRRLRITTRPDVWIRHPMCRRILLTGLSSVHGVDISGRYVVGTGFEGLSGLPWVEAGIEGHLMVTGHPSCAACARASSKSYPCLLCAGSPVVVCQSARNAACPWARQAR